MSKVSIFPFGAFVAPSTRFPFVTANSVFPTRRSPPGPGTSANAVVRSPSGVMRSIALRGPALISMPPRPSGSRFSILSRPSTTVRISHGTQSAWATAGSGLRPESAATRALTTAVIRTTSHLLWRQSFGVRASLSCPPFPSRQAKDGLGY
jgi:hypothetical protein